MCKFFHAGNCKYRGVCKSLYPSKAAPAVLEEEMPKHNRMSKRKKRSPSTAEVVTKRRMHSVGLAGTVLMTNRCAAAISPTVYLRDRSPSHLTVERLREVGGDRCELNRSFSKSRKALSDAEVCLVQGQRLMTKGMFRG